MSRRTGGFTTYLSAAMRWSVSRRTRKVRYVVVTVARPPSAQLTPKSQWNNVGTGSVKGESAGSHQDVQTAPAHLDLSQFPHAPSWNEMTPEQQQRLTKFREAIAAIDLVLEWNDFAPWFVNSEQWPCKNWGAG